MQFNIENSTVERNVFNDFSDQRSREQLGKVVNVNEPLPTKEIKKEDEQGVKGFIQENKGNFFTNVLSNVASSGLIETLKILMRL